MAVRRVTKEQLIEGLRRIQQQGWIESVRPRSAGGIGNTIDRLLGFPDNNLPISDTAQWELKSHRQGSASLITLLHAEPHPRSAHIVPRVLLPFYGWPDAKGRPNESSFRQTIRATGWSDRGFRVVMQRDKQRIAIEFDPNQVEEHHREWLDSVADRVGLGPLDPQPYWPLPGIELSVSTKMLNTFYVEVETQRHPGREMFAVQSVLTLQGFNLDGFTRAFDDGTAYIDFDARTHHNHGTKFRLRNHALPQLYRYVERVV